MKEKKSIKNKILHIITGLNTGGAEMMLYKIISDIDRAAVAVEVISLLNIGAVGRKIQDLGVPVHALGMRRGVPNPLYILRLARRLREDPPNCIQTWMYHADLIGGLAAKLAGSIPVTWGIRHSNLDPQGTKRTTLWAAKACARLSRRLPARIVCCSEASRRVHTELGYAADKMVVIPNGFDLAVFKPDPKARLDVRQELGIPEEGLLIGLIGRFAPQKDHYNFVCAAAHLNACLPNIHFLLCGAGVTRENPELIKWISDAGILSQCHLLGEREDMPRLTASLDIATSSSYSEGFPNVIGEAMACGVPCVVTDAGDSALIAGKTGKVVPPKDPRALSEGWLELLKMNAEGRKRLGWAARQRIEEHFSLPSIVNKYNALYKEVAGMKIIGQR
ncbi:MAG: putative glycosyltransferase EpsF [Pelotomaculum sp. PtaU1.Bin065]|nr:MAG: putative glycosyltransferase EpsF [Pelotomaculum sp. PtaU1.Bin065]